MQPSRTKCQRGPSLRARGAVCSFIALIFAAACSESTAPPPESSQTDAGADAAPVDASVDATTTLRPVCTPGTTLTCVCEGGTGQRACIDGQLSPTCDDCVAVGPVDNASPCREGRYEGAFDVPQYLPTAAGCGGLGTLFGGPGSGTLGFTLRATPQPELISVVEAESCFEMNVDRDDAGASADRGVASVSFALSGDVDCQTGVLEGEIQGAYYVPQGLCSAEAWYSVKGTIRAVFDPASETFIDGTIDLYEPKQLADEIGLAARAGGSGTWEARLDPDAQPAEPVDDCLMGAKFTDFEI